jgi:arylsulfatase A-like enzyme
MNRSWNIRLALLASLAFALVAPATASAQQQQKPNILVIMGDDIGYFNISAYNRGMMGYRTPNIDRIAAEGAIFTDYYGQQSCTAGRAAFITGQSPLRTGLLKVGLPAAKEGLSEKDPTIADLLKPHGYATAQFGKNHLGDRNEFLPTVHGFDVFFGNLYHLNAEEEPENPDYPKGPNFKAQFGPRGVLKCVATTTDTPGDDPRFGPWGKQKCEDTGPLTKKRMETIDEEFLKATTDFIDGAVRDRKPFFVWFNSTRMHIWTHLKPASQGKTGLGIYPDGMVEHDGQVGELLKKLDDLGIANNTIVIYTTDNGAETFSWPDGGATPFRGEKNTNWEGGYRVPAMIRWPGLVPPRTEINEIFSAEDWRPRWSLPPASRTSRRSCCRATMPRVRISACTSTATTSVTCSGATAPTSAASSSTGPTTAILPVCAMSSGRPCSWSSERTASTSGRSRWCSCAFPGCSICAPTRSSVPSMSQGTTCGGSSSTPTCWSRRRPWWGSISRASGNSRRASGPAASRSSKRWRSSEVRRRAIESVSCGRHLKGTRRYTGASTRLTANIRWRTRRSSVRRCTRPA